MYQQVTYTWPPTFALHLKDITILTLFRAVIPSAAQIWIASLTRHHMTILHRFHIQSSPSLIPNICDRVTAADMCSIFSCHKIIGHWVISWWGRSHTFVIYFDYRYWELMTTLSYLRKHCCHNTRRRAIFCEILPHCVWFGWAYMSLHFDTVRHLAATILKMTRKYCRFYRHCIIHFQFHKRKYGTRYTWWIQQSEFDNNILWKSQRRGSC